MKNKFKAAFNGLKNGFLHKSVLIQYFLALLAVIAGLIMHLSALEWTIVILCIGCVITAELLNTCIEKLCNLYTTDYDEKIREIKDIAAGAVLAASLAALVIALIILFRHIGG
jgi:undecaprenol kinase/diacylglycerol kinase (ATP)